MPYVIESHYNYDWTYDVSVMFEGTKEECEKYLKQGNAGYGGSQEIVTEKPKGNFYVFANGAAYGDKRFPIIYSNIVFQGKEDECKKFISTFSLECIIRNHREKLLYDLIFSARFVGEIENNLENWDDNFAINFADKYCMEKVSDYPDGCPMNLVEKLMDEVDDQKRRVLKHKWSFNADEEFFERLIQISNFRWTNIMDYSEEEIMRVYIQNRKNPIYNIKEIIGKMRKYYYDKYLPMYDETSLFLLIDFFIHGNYVPSIDIERDILDKLPYCDDPKEKALAKNWDFEGMNKKTIVEEVIKKVREINWTNIIYFTSGHIFRMYKNVRLLQ